MAGSCRSQQPPARDVPHVCMYVCMYCVSHAGAARCTPLAVVTVCRILSIRSLPCPPHRSTGKLQESIATNDEMSDVVAARDVTRRLATWRHYCSTARQQPAATYSSLQRPAAACSSLQQPTAALLLSATARCGGAAPRRTPPREVQIKVTARNKLI